MYERFGPPNLKWCEERLCAWANEPANTWSNLGYLLVAVLIYRRSARENSPLGRAFGVVVFLMGLFSLVFHATNNYLTQVFDFLGMFLYVFLIVCLNAFRLGWVKRESVIPLYLGLVIGATLVLQACRALGLPYQGLIAVAALAIVVTEALNQKRARAAGRPLDTRAFWAAAAVFAAAEALSLADAARLLCDPRNHWLQGHAAWHVLGAAGVWLSFAYYRPFLPEAGALPNSYLPETAA